VAIVESRVKEGTLLLGTAPGLDVSCQITNIRINSAYSDDGDSLETLCGDIIPPARKHDGSSLAGTFVQDWTGVEAEQVSAYLWEHHLEEVEFEYNPHVDGPTFTGIIRLERPSEMFGGDVNTRITSDFEWFAVGDVTRTPPVVTFEALTVDQLKAQAAEKGLPTSGTKAELIERLQGELVPA
jgi:hypothetical protein